MEQAIHQAIHQAREGQYLSFILDNQGYAVPILSVREINQVSDITPVPKVPEFVKGVINLRGKIIPVVDLKLKFGMAMAEFKRETCIVVIETATGQVGMIVDQVSDVVDLAPHQIEPAPLLGEKSKMDFLTGIGKLNDRVLILIDIVRALAKDQFLAEFNKDKNPQSSGQAA